MFEKEAEEYANRCACLMEDIPIIERAYRNGAEFGYNKGFEFGVKSNEKVNQIVDNEWHYVKDGDLPKAYQKCYFIYSNVYGLDGKISFSKSDINVLTGVYAFFIDEETGEETTEPCFYDDINDDEICLKEVYAWKEIVLPELPKEIE